MLELNHKQANAIANYLCRQGLPLSATFQADDSSEFIWESMEWLIENIKNWKGTFPKTLLLQANRLSATEFVMLIAKLAGVTLETEVETVEPTAVEETKEETMVTLNYEQANKVVEYLSAQGLPVFATFQPEDSSVFIWESLVWLVHDIKTWKTFPPALVLQANRLSAEDFIKSLCRLAGVELV